MTKPTKNEKKGRACDICGRRRRIIVCGRGTGLAVCVNPDRCFPKHKGRSHE